MITIENMGMKTLNIENLLLDYNGTIATDGKVIAEIKERIEAIKAKGVNVYCLTADSYGNAAKQCEFLGIEVKTFCSADAATEKARIVNELEGDSAAVGNGFNDIKMLESSALAIAVIGDEGCCSKLLPHADIVVHNIFDALDLLLKPNRVVALLRG